MLTLPLLCVLACRAPEVPQPNHFKRYLWTVAAAQIADNVSTQFVLTPYLVDGRQRVRGDINPLLPRDRGSNAIVQSATTIAVLVLLRKMEPSHPKLARMIAAGLIGLGTADTIRNVHYYRLNQAGVP